MRTRTRNPFTTISTAGLLLPVDLLTRIVDGDPNLPGLTPRDYHLRSGERLNEAASRAWNESLAAWKSFRKKFAALPASDTGTTLTRDEWLLRLFQELGYGRLQPKRAIVIDGKEYPISHGWEDHVPIHLLSARYSIDRRTPGAAGAATRAPYSLLQELLNRSGQHRWGFVTNGLKLYLLHDNAALARAANVEFDLEAMMDGELYADFMLLFLLCHQSRVEIQPTPIAKVTLDRKTGKARKAKTTGQKKLVTDDDADGDDSIDADDEKTRLGPENCWLERWANQADQQGTRARDKLRDGVEAAIKSLGAGFLTTKGNQKLRDRMGTGELSTQDYYRQLLRVVYRLLMLLVAEEKKTENGANLFHPPGTSPEVCDRYARFYSVSRIRTLAYERRGTAHTDLYESLKILFLKLREGYAPLGIPGMGSFLFSDDSTPDLDDAFLANQDLLDAFRNLCYTEDTSGRGGSIRRPVDFGSLGSDELGSVYESLLELHPKIGTDEGPFTLGTASGNERKTTGSYYTPTSLINCLLDSALDPVVHAAIKDSERMASGEWGMVTGPFREEFMRYARQHAPQRLSGPGRVAARSADRQSDLSPDANVSQGRALRDDLSDAASGDIDSSEHRRGLGTALPGGVHSVPPDRQRQPGRTGIPSDNQLGRGTLHASGNTADPGRTDDAGQAASQPGTEFEEANGERQIANRKQKEPALPPLAIPHSPFATLWTSTPLAVRYSLFAEHALLALKVCDPACGSGHFLIAAAERMAMHLARLRTGDDEPNTLDVQHAKRDIIGRCIYGVDINPMAVELCKVALWMEAMEPGKPFSYLDHHIQCGNSLLGTTPALLAKGIPDDAFTAIEGDVKSRVSELKKQNKKERLDRINRQTELFEPPLKLGNLSSEFVRLNILDDDSISDIRSMEERYTALVRGADYQNARLLADTWCAAFVWKKDDSDLGKLCPTERDFRKVESQAAAGLLPHVRTEVARLHDQYQFFHWHLAYPDVFRMLVNEERPENEQTGWSGGFDVVVGNPPWDKIQPEEEKFFASLAPDIVNAASAKTRKELISALPTTEPQLHMQWIEYKRRIEAHCHSIKSGGSFPLASDGNLNTYRLFTELASSLLALLGRTGVIVQTAIATGESGKELFDHLLTSQRLLQFLDFENRESFFQAVDDRFRFCLLTACGSGRAVGDGRATFGWLLHSLEELAVPGRLVRLDARDLQLFNPTSKTCPVLTSEGDLAVSRRIYNNAVHIFVNEQQRFLQTELLGELFNLTRDSRFFLTPAVGGQEAMLPLFEAKFLHQFDHRFARSSDGIVKDSALEQKQLSDYRISTSKVVEAAEVQRRLREREISTKWLAGFRRISSGTNERTAIMTVFPVGAVGNTINLVFNLGATDTALLLANVNCFAFDFSCRQKVSGTDINLWIFKQLPVVSPATYTQTGPWSGADDLRKDSSLLSAWLLPRVLELTYTAWDLEPFAQDCGYDGPPFRWDEERRFRLRAELDAAFFHLYLPAEANGEWGKANGEFDEQGHPLATRLSLLAAFPTPRDAVSYIMDTFPIVRRKDIAKHGTYRTKDAILEIYDAMQTAIRTGIPYQTPLDPPPGPPTDANGQFIPFAQWTGHLNTAHIHPPCSP